MNTRNPHIQAGNKGMTGRLILMMVFLLSLPVVAGCISSYRNVKEIHQLPSGSSATIRVVIYTTSEGKILQQEIEKDYWRLPGGFSFPYPVLNYEWYLWLAMDREVYPLIPKGRSFLTNVPLIHEGDVANLVREYPVPLGAHTYWLEFAGMRPYVYTSGSSTDVVTVSNDGHDDGGDYEGETRLGMIWKHCFSADLQPGQVVTVKIDDTGVHLPEEVRAEPISNCNEWLFGPPVETYKRNLP
ncbi:MAG: hypothetical protein JRI22_08810 [Deltaproteobacteria bacterium]|nr:hypothetical protein [Deltaproteobacteria bacterium]